jgi:hypothetical protein
LTCACCIYSRRSFSDLSDDEVNTFLEWVGQQDVQKRSFSDLSDDQVNTFLEWVGQQDIQTPNKREVLSRNALTDLLEKAVKALTPAALTGLEKLLGGASTATAPAAPT